MVDILTGLEAILLVGLAILWGLSAYFFYRANRRSFRIEEMPHSQIPTSKTTMTTETTFEYCHASKGMDEKNANVPKSKQRSAKCSRSPPARLLSAAMGMAAKQATTNDTLAPATRHMNASAIASPTIPPPKATSYSENCWMTKASAANTTPPKNPATRMNCS